ncbi:MAG: response regulator transcription factor [Bryobacteraceae bacterium]
MIRVSVIAASNIVRAGLESLLRASPSVVVVRSYSALSEVGEESGTSILLLDLDGTEDAPPGSLVLTDTADPAWISQALRDGVRAILPRTASGAEIIAAVESVAAGLVVLHRDYILLAVPGSTNETRELPPHPEQPLTPREMEVLRMLSDGHGNKTIAWKMNISEHTVKFHVASIFSKLNVSTRTEAVTLGVRLGLILL